MQRRREVAAAPQRDAHGTWTTISALVEATLARSPSIDESDVQAELEHARGVGRMLVAGGHLDREPLVLVAGDLRLEIATVSADAALTLEENLEAVPGAGKAETWVLHFPLVSPLESIIASMCSGHPNLSDEPPGSSSDDEAARASFTLDEAALRRWEAAR
ncbi:MAG TPA: hypothetical protein VGO39_14565 [Gaiellaceae bacterium]|jgi:hypothetical protein|nr:hypothetical protein [Gaiellaceae bacterium]